MTIAVTYLGCVLLLIGAAFVLLAAIGMLRLPDVLTRMHAASKAGVVGGGIILLAVGIVSLDIAVLVRAILGIVFLLLVTPLSAHLLARVAYGDRDARNVLARDELDTRGDLQIPARYNTDTQISGPVRVAPPSKQS